MKYALFFSALILIFLFISGCEEPVKVEEKPHQLVVSAFLAAGERIDSVFISQIGDILSLYDPNSAAVQNANVTITLIEPNNSTGNITYTLNHDGEMPGRYYSSAVVQPMATYLLKVEAPGFPTVTGSTSVPDTFSITNTESFPDTLVFDSDSPEKYIKWTASRNHAGYICRVSNLEKETQKIPRDYSEDDIEPTKTVGFFNTPNNSSAELPWLLINYYGRTQFAVEAIDENYLNYLEQVSVMDSYDLREIHYSLQGGLGVFGSYARANRSPITVIKP
ncbi:MAG: DUF4249 family protein [Bacteroidetes bacterium]|nr:DUF4249 family protein [Bacteroidota bacterium]